jgi:hypothetical protein
MALGQKESLMLGVIVPMTLLGLSFAVLVAPLTASVMSSVDQTDEGLTSGINNAASRIAQLAGVALAAGVASFASGYEVGLAVAAATSLGGAFTASITLTPAAAESGRLGRGLERSTVRGAKPRARMRRVGSGGTRNPQKCWVSGCRSANAAPACPGFSPTYDQPNQAVRNLMRNIRLAW